MKTKKNNYPNHSPSFLYFPNSLHLVVEYISLHVHGLLLILSYHFPLLLKPLLWHNFTLPLRGLARTHPIQNQAMVIKQNDIKLKQIKTTKRRVNHNSCSMLKISQQQMLKTYVVGRGKGGGLEKTKTGRNVLCTLWHKYKQPVQLQMFRRKYSQRKVTKCTASRTSV